MKSEIFAIHDAAIKAFRSPYFLRNAGEAIRGFTDLANDPQTTIHQHPGDFTLFHCGSYDDDTGLVTSFDAPISLGNALNYKYSPSANAGDIVTEE